MLTGLFWHVSCAGLGRARDGDDEPGARAQPRRRALQARTPGHWASGAHHPALHRCAATLGACVQVDGPDACAYARTCVWLIVHYLPSACKVPKREGLSKAALFCWAGGGGGGSALNSPSLAQGPVSGGVPNYVPRQPGPGSAGQQHGPMSQLLLSPIPADTSSGLGTSIASQVNCSPRFNIPCPELSLHGQRSSVLERGWA